MASFLAVHIPITTKSAVIAQETMEIPYAATL